MTKERRPLDEGIELKKAEERHHFTQVTLVEPRAAWNPCPPPVPCKDKMTSCSEKALSKWAFHLLTATYIFTIFAL